MMLTLSWVTAKPLRAHEDDEDDVREHGWVHEDDDDDVREHGSIVGVVNITPKQAQEEAQKVVTGKVVLSVELDYEHGAPVYEVHFDDGTEVKVDAVTGVVMYVELSDDHHRDHSTITGTSQSHDDSADRRHSEKRRKEAAHHRRDDSSRHRPRKRESSRGRRR